MRGLYVHIPFCLKKCNYCDFCSFDNLENGTRDKYIEALIQEIKSYKREEKLKLNTVFFGGGTPSLLTPLEFSKIAAAIEESFDLGALEEWTLEANPKTLTREKLLAYRSAGVNRISIGLQSIHENEMKKLGRIHNLANFETALSLTRSVGIDNIKVDLMFGIPEQTKESFNKTLDYVLSLGISHISLYGLIIEENTPFGRMRDKLTLPSEDTEADMYFLAAKKLSDVGFSHYEISNYARPGFPSRHNLIYWRREEYIGVGLAAHSLFDGERFSNTEKLSEYLSQTAEQYRMKEKISPDDVAYEYVMLRLRLDEGFSLKEYEEKFAKSFLEGREEKLKNYEKLGLLRISRNRISLTERGFYLSNAILSDLL